MTAIREVSSPWSAPPDRYADGVQPRRQEASELLPRYRGDNIFDSSKFAARFPDFKVTTYYEGFAAILDD